MPFYLRKSISAGPFRFNFSGSGIGISVGVKGFRIGTGPRGHYIHAGRDGVYYRATLNSSGSKRARSSSHHQSSLRPTAPQSTYVEGVEMLEVESGAAQAMTSEAFGDLLNEINLKQSQMRMAIFLPCCIVALGLLLMFGVNASTAPVLLLALPGWAIGQWLDSFRRTSVLLYDLESPIESSYHSVTRAFDELAACCGKWHVEAGGTVRDLMTWKRNAGARYIVRKSVTTLTYKTPRVIKSNLTPPAIHVGKQVLYFFPDVLLIEDGAGFGAIDYSRLRMECANSNFIEEGNVPKDAKIISYTWKHPNKGGGPDRRFNNNYQIPVCRYEALHFSSASGLNELLEFSKVGAPSVFAASLRSLVGNCPVQMRGYLESPPLT